MDIGAILIGVAVLIVAAFLISQPLLGGRQQREKTLGEADRLCDERDRILATLRDLDFDHASGKVLEEDYAPLRANLVAEGAAVLKRLDELKPAAAAPRDDEVERAIAARRHAAGAGRAPASADLGASAKADQVERAIAARRRRGTSAAATPAAADDVEQAIAARRRKARPAAEGEAKVYCSQCGQAALPNDKFCAKCGAPLRGATSTSTRDSA